MVIQLDRCYKICFKNEEEGAGANFSILDGFYEVVRSYGWGELNGAGIDLQEYLLDHAGIVDKSALKTLRVNWTNDAFYYCIGMDENRQIWVPESIIKGYPDPRIGSYKKLGLVLDLGVFSNVTDFESIGKDIMKYLKANYGIDRPDATVTVYGNQWMTIEDYENTDLTRKSIMGLAYTTEEHWIKPSDTLIDTKITFGTPVIRTKDNENVIRGAISETIKMMYGLDFLDLPHGDANSNTPCWYYEPAEVSAYAWRNEEEKLNVYTRYKEMSVNGYAYSDAALRTTCGKITAVSGDTITVQDGDDPAITFTRYSQGNVQVDHDELPTNTALERELDLSFTAIVLGSVHVKTKFRKDSYKWITSEKSIYTKEISPNVGGTVYIDEECLNPLDEKITAVEDGVSITVGGVVYDYCTDKNNTKLTIGYRCRNAVVQNSSPYSQAIKYAYENIELKQRIAALEEIIETGSTQKLRDQLGLPGKF